MQKKTISRKIAKFAVNLKYKDLPENIVHEVKRYLYDSIGCAIGSMETQDVKILHELYRDMGGKEEATVFGFGDRMPAVNSTLINSLMIRSLDFNDIYWMEDPSHPSDLIPAALAVGELTDASMKEVITAIVLAYEFEQRFCEFAVPGLRERKWHHATITQFVSPIVSGKILGLNVDQMVNAIGIGGCHNHTIGCPTAGKLTMMKNTVDPMAVQAGVMAALLAQKGYTGPEAIFDGKEGLMDVYGPKWALQKLFDGLGQNYKILECSMKAFPTEALTHTHLTAVLKLVKAYDISYDTISQVTVTTIARACDILFDPHKYRPDSRETADHSLPYCIAAALVDHEVTTQSFSDGKLKDPRIWKVIDKIKGVASKKFEKIFPEKQPSRVVIETSEGKEYSETIEYPKGHPNEPMSMNDLVTKFNTLTNDWMSPKRQVSLKDHIFNCESLTARDFMKGLVIMDNS